MTQLRLIDVGRAPTKTCASCRLDKPRIEFGRSILSPSGLQDWCRDCFALNLRLNHNARDEPPRPRRSPYDVLEEYLAELDLALACRDVEEAHSILDRLRDRLGLAA